MSPSFLLSTVTMTEIRLSTTTTPLRSRMRPRGASSRIVRVCSAAAAALNSFVAMTCRYQRRAKRAANSDTMAIPRIPSRSLGLLFTSTLPSWDHQPAGPRRRGHGPAHDAEHRKDEDGVHDGDGDGDDPQMRVEEPFESHDLRQQPEGENTDHASTDRRQHRYPPCRAEHGGLCHPDDVTRERVTECEEAEGRPVHHEVEHEPRGEPGDGTRVAAVRDGDGDRQQHDDVRTRRTAVESDRQ